MKSVCIVRLSALGDVLMLVPLVRALQDDIACVYRITWIISRPAYELVSNLGGVEFIIINKPRKITDLLCFKKLLRGRNFDILLATQASLSANLLYPFIKAKRKIGYDKIRAKDGHWLFINEAISSGNDHTVDGFLKFANILGVKDYLKPRWNLIIPDINYTWVYDNISRNQNFIVINPAASKPERSWLVTRYVELIQVIQKKFQILIVLTGGPSLYDRNLANQILNKIHCIDLVGKTTPQQLLAVIKLAKLVICPDTGPSHMATAVGTPVVALHAVTSSKVSGPYNYLNLAVDYYDVAVNKFLRKSKVLWGTHVHGNNTMELITVTHVLQKINQVLNF